MVHHSLVKIFVAVLDIYLSKCAKTKLLRAKGQVGFRKNHRTNEHIFTLTFVFIDEAKANKHKVCCYFVDFHKAFVILHNPFAFAN